MSEDYLQHLPTVQNLAMASKANRLRNSYCEAERFIMEAVEDGEEYCFIPDYFLYGHINEVAENLKALGFTVLKEERKFQSLKESMLYKTAIATEGECKHFGLLVSWGSYSSSHKTWRTIHKAHLKYGARFLRE